MIKVPVLMHRVGEALEWLLNCRDYSHPGIDRADQSLDYWREIAKQGPSPHSIMFQFGEQQKELAMIFKMTWSG